MRIDFKSTPSPLLALLIVACSSLADPDDRAITPPRPGMSMPALEPDADDNPGADPEPQLPPAARSCEAAGQTYPDGYPVPSGDTCNSCRCSDGFVLCTGAVCGTSPGASCEVAEQSFPDGSDIPSGDNCNSCSCDDGSVTCTEIACDPVECALFIEASDGTCARLPLDPCLFQDPDCSAGAAACVAAGQLFASGSDIPSGDTCNSCGCDDGSVSCSELACDDVFCALFVEASDGVCSRFPLDPCASQDPDCGVGAGPGGASCDVAGQSFPDGSDIPSGDSCNSCGCNDGSVACTLGLCEPEECALFVEASDGVCARFPLDPCIFQDPDCIDSSEPLQP